MLAIKLHKKPKPWLGKGSYFIPIFNWEYGKRYIRNWRSTLETKDKRGRCKYISLIKIPDETVIYIGDDWKRYPEYLEKQNSAGGSMPIIVMSMKGIWVRYLKYDWKEYKRVYNLFWRKLKEHSKKYSKEPEWFDSGKSGGKVMTHPEIILGERLPDSCIKWTKDIKLLYGKEKNVKKKRKRE